VPGWLHAARRRASTTLLALAALAPPAAWAQATATVDFGPSIYVGMVARFDPRTEPGFDTLRDELRYLLAERGVRGPAQHFCVVGYRWPDGHGFASVQWREGGMIMRWHGGDDWSGGGLSWALHKGVDLATGVIDADDPGGSTFMETRRDAEGTLEDCRRHGRQYVVRPPRARRAAREPD